MDATTGSVPQVSGNGSRSDAQTETTPFTTENDIHGVGYALDVPAPSPRTLLGFQQAAESLALTFIALLADGSAICGVCHRGSVGGCLEHSPWCGPGQLLEMSETQREDRRRLGLTVALGANVGPIHKTVRSGDDAASRLPSAPSPAEETAMRKYRIQTGGEADIDIIVDEPNLRTEIHDLFCSCDHPGTCDNEYLADFDDSFPGQWEENGGHWDLEDGWVKFTPIAVPEPVSPESVEQRLDAAIASGEIPEMIGMPERHVVYHCRRAIAVFGELEGHDVLTCDEPAEHEGWHADSNAGVSWPKEAASIKRLACGRLKVRLFGQLEPVYIMPGEPIEEVAEPSPQAEQPIESDESWEASEAILRAGRN